MWACILAVFAATCGGGFWVFVQLFMALPLRDIFAVCGGVFLGLLPLREQWLLGVCTAVWGVNFAI